MEWPGSLDTVREVDIETRGADGVVHRTTIWPVVEAGQVYVRSLRGTAGRWYTEATAQPDTVLHAEGEALPIRVVPADDDESIELANAAYHRKYADSPYLATMTRDEILSTTLRLEPR